MPSYSTDDFLQHLAGHVRDPRVRNDAATRSRPRAPTRASPTITPGPAHLSIGQEAAAVGMAFSLDARRSHLRLASQPRRDSGQGLLGDPATERRADCWTSWGPIATARCCGPWKRATPARVKRPRAALLHLRRVQRDLRARDGLQSRARRIDARVLRAVRHLSEQRDRRRVRLDCARRGALQARESQARHRRRQHRRLLVRLRSGVGRHHLLGDGSIPQAVGRVARRRPADHLQLHEQLLRHGRPAARRNDGRRSSSRASAPASTRSRCTPSASTATIRCR